jgi:putative DNA primase/helicase
MSSGGSFSFPGAPSPEELARLPLNDLGNAQRLIRLVGGAFDDDGMVDTTAATLLYLRNRGWIAFNGKYWDLEAGEEIARRRAHQVAQGLFGQGAHRFGEEEKPPKYWVDFVNRSGNAGSSAAMLAQAASYLTVGLDQFDRQALTLNLRNGTLKFLKDDGGKVSVKFRPVHDPADRLTRMAEVDYDPKAKAPLFEGHVAFCQRDEAMRLYLQAVLGYTSTGSTREQLFFILQGKGGDGKSTLVNAVRDVMGSYAFTAGVETFLDTGVKKSGDASPDIARLAGDTRLICTAEPQRGAKLATGAIKNFTGGGSITARELRQGIFEFEPIGKVVLECNGRPTINDTDDGIWRRIRIILFENQVPIEQIDRELKDKLKLERAGILNWLIDGAKRWLAEGLKTPEKVASAGDDYRRGSNPFGEWRAERLIMDPQARTLASELYGDYKTWCEDNGHDRPMAQTAFGRALGDLQVLRDGLNSRGKQIRKGAKLGLVNGVGSFEATAFDSPSSSSGPAPEPPLSAYDVGDYEGS